MTTIERVRAILATPAPALSVDVQAFVLATIQAESAFDPGAYRPEPKIGDASRGLGQLLERTARKLGFTGDADALYNLDLNLHFTVRYVLELRAVLGTWADVASAYNCGLRDVDGKRIDVPAEGRAPFRSACGAAAAGTASNQAHVRRVLGYMDQWLAKIKSEPYLTTPAKNLIVGSLVPATAEGPELEGGPELPGLVPVALALAVLVIVLILTGIL